jgi:hypothetical protein
VSPSVVNVIDATRGRPGAASRAPMSAARPRGDRTSSRSRSGRRRHGEGARLLGEDRDGVAGVSPNGASVVPAA